MAATAPATAATTAATATTTAAATATTAAAADPSPSIPEKCMHKNRLQSFAQRTLKKLPLYTVEVEGEYHQPKFRCTVEVDGQQFSSAGSFNNKKEAEQDAARVAYESLVTVGEDDVKESLGMIDQPRVFCKSILHEFAVKTKTIRPSYSVVHLVKPFTMFVASVVFDGNTYTGESAPNKKDAEQNAAHEVIKSILATYNPSMVEIIRSKEHLITAVRSSGNIPTTFTPIKFTRPVAYSAYGRPDHAEPVSHESSSTAVQGHSIVPTVGPSDKPSTKVVTGSKKRKGRVEGPDVNEARVTKEH